MSEYEILVLAAKAAGVVYDEAASQPKEGREWWGLWLKIEGEPSEYDRRYWNPLADDGDAMRLANRCCICIEFGYCSDDAPVVRCGQIENWADWPMVANFPDPGKATRRAIVEAAVAKQLEYERVIAECAIPEAGG